MSAGVYSSLAAVYMQTIMYNFQYVGYAHWILKLPTFCIALLYTFPLLICVAIFQLLIILDWISNFVSYLRRSLLSFLDNSSYNIRTGFMSFIFSPLAMMIVCPLLFITFLLPKFSSNDVDDIVTKSTVGAFVGAGAFKQVSSAMLSAIKNIFRYVANSHVILMPFLGFVALFYSLIFICLSLLFAILIPLDWISSLIELSRRYTLLTVVKLRDASRNQIFGFLLAPIVLFILAPAFFIVLIVPKLTSHVDAAI